jgi:hypothetical protein
MSKNSIAVVAVLLLGAVSGIPAPSPEAEVDDFRANAELVCYECARYLHNGIELEVALLTAYLH